MSRIVGDYIIIGKASFLVEAVKGKTLKKLKEENPQFSPSLLKTLQAELKANKIK